MGRSTSLTRVLALAATVALVAALWMPRPWARALHLNNNWLQAILCAVVAVALTEAFAVRSPGLRVFRRVRWIALGLVLLCGTLEIGQVFAGRSALLHDFLINAAAAVTGIYLYFAYRRHQAPPQARDLASNRT